MSGLMRWGLIYDESIYSSIIHSSLYFSFVFEYEVAICGCLYYVCIANNRNIHCAIFSEEFSVLNIFKR